jgi:hypothetical protein
MKNAPVNKDKEGGNMRRHVSLILAIILLITCSGCFWDRGRGGYDEHDRGGYGEHEERH